MDGLMQEIDSREKISTEGELNGHVGKYGNALLNNLAGHI